jgi:nicotinate-nucleotide adenylyltransferase
MVTVGVLGGTFDPIHKAHLQVATAVLAHCPVERILFVPAAVPPHKTRVVVSPIERRLEMVQVAVAGFSAFAVSDIEKRNDRPSYTYNTLTTLIEQTSGAIRFSFIVGSDMFLEIETWYRWRDLLRSADFIVAVRAGYPSHDVVALLDHYGYVGEPSGAASVRYRRCDGSEIHLLTAPIDAISATDIRERIRSGAPWRHLVPPGVAAVIDRHYLYQATDQ